MAESTRQREAFDTYWRLGAERSVERPHATHDQSEYSSHAMSSIF